MGRDYSKDTTSATPYTTHGELEWLIDGAIDSEHEYAAEREEQLEWYDGIERELVERGQGAASEALIRHWQEYENALHAALRSFASDVCGEGLRFDLSWADECMADDGPLNVYHTLEGAGVGIWDGCWSAHFTDDKQGEASLEALQAHLKRKLGRYVHDCGGGSLVEAVGACAWRIIDECPRCGSWPHGEGSCG